LDGPLPKRPSRGLISAGRSIWAEVTRPWCG
jgi:hypothetical protein